MTISVEAGGPSDLIASLCNLTVNELAAQDAGQKLLGRWVAYDGGTAIGVATAFERVDDRVFVVHRLRSETAFAPLLAAAVSSLGCAINLSLPTDQVNRVDAAVNLGFCQDYVSAMFLVPIEPLRQSLSRLVRPTTVALVSAADVQTDTLYRLDSKLRNDVPGLDGWRGNRQWFDDEMASDEYDPRSYIVARAANNDLVGLCRIWRKPTGPALGMLGVTMPYRRGTVALALLRRALEGLDRDSPSITTYTARPTLQRRLRRLGAIESGGFVNLHRAESAS